jgi:hypothetical protein
LAQTFAEVVENWFTNDPEGVWSFCLRFTLVSAEEAAVNNPREFLPVCGTVAAGTVGSMSRGLFQGSLSNLRNLANDLLPSCDEYDFVLGNANVASLAF